MNNSVGDVVYSETGEPGIIIRECTEFSFLDTGKVKRKRWWIFFPKKGKEQWLEDDNIPTTYTKQHESR